MTLAEALQIARDAKPKRRSRIPMDKLRSSGGLTPDQIALTAALSKSVASATETLTRVDKIASRISRIEDQMNREKRLTRMVNGNVAETMS